jgi:hypothetical protein
MKRMFISYVFGFLTIVATLSLPPANNAYSTLITFTEANLASGNPVTVGGITLTTTTIGGGIGFIPTGQFTGLWLGGSNEISGNYTFSLSQPVTSIEIEFDALSATGAGAPETLSNFTTNLGPASIGYSNQFGTSFNGTTITALDNDGQGIITFSGPAFSSFSFQHNQAATQNGFVIERLVVNAVPEPGSLVLGLTAGAAGLFVRRRRSC